MTTSPKFLRNAEFHSKHSIPYFGGIQWMEKNTAERKAAFQNNWMNYFSLLPLLNYSVKSLHNGKSFPNYGLI